MKAPFLLCFVSITLVLFSCKQKPSLDKTINDFADLECRAMILREKRFALANQIRFTSDTLRLQASASDTAKLRMNLENFNKEKESLLGNSLALADTIHKVLDSLMRTQLTEAETKTEFNQKLNATLKERGCLDKNDQ